MLAGKPELGDQESPPFEEGLCRRADQCSECGGDGIAMTETYELIAIGSGPAGESAPSWRRSFGHRAAVIEKAGRGEPSRRRAERQTKTLREAALYFRGSVREMSMACG